MNAKICLCEKRKRTSTPLYTHVLEAGEKLKDGHLDVLYVNGALPHSPDIPFELLDVGKWHTLSLVLIF